MVNMRLEDIKTYCLNKWKAYGDYFKITLKCTADEIEIRSIRPDDLCMVAESCRHILGAVWTRILAGKVKGYGNVDDHTPEFAISVK